MEFNNPYSQYLNTADEPYAPHTSPEHQETSFHTDCPHQGPDFVPSWTSNSNTNTSHFPHVVGPPQHQETGFHTDFPHQKADFRPSWTSYSNTNTSHFPRVVGPPPEDQQTGSYAKSSHQGAGFVPSWSPYPNTNTSHFPQVVGPPPEDQQTSFHTKFSHQGADFMPAWTPPANANHSHFPQHVSLPYEQASFVHSTHDNGFLQHPVPQHSGFQPTYHPTAYRPYLSYDDTQNQQTFLGQAQGLQQQLPVTQPQASGLGSGEAPPVNYRLLKLDQLKMLCKERELRCSHNPSRPEVVTLLEQMTGVDCKSLKTAQLQQMCKEYGIAYGKRNYSKEVMIGMLEEYDRAIGTGE